MEKKHLGKSVLPHLGFFAILLLFSVIYYDGILDKLPFGIHEWAQGDRLSLAINFYDNGLNFFKPATHNQLSVHGIVGVEFPAQSYIAGALGYIFGRDAISTCFRVEGLLVAWIGLYFLFRIVYDRTRNFVLSIVTPLIIFCSPVFVCYSVNYLPDPAGVCMVFAAFYFFLQYADKGTFSRLLISLILLTLAVLIKATTASYWLGIVCYGLYQEIIIRKDRRRALSLISAAFLAGIIILAEHWYINYLNDTYHSTLFLAQFCPFPDWDAYNTYTNFPFKEVWMKEYFLLAEYPLMTFIIAGGVNALLKVKSIRHYLRPIIIFLPCALLFFYLFGSQLIVHDYYMLAIFFPLITYLLVISIIGLKQRLTHSGMKELQPGFVAALLLVFFLADHQIYNRLHMIGNYDNNYSYRWLSEGAAVLDSAKVPKSEQIVVAGDNAPNLSLVYFNRKGYVIPGDAWNDELGNGTRYLREKALRYIIMREGSLTHILSKDSNAIAGYDIVLIDKDKAVLRLK